LIAEKNTPEDYLYDQRRDPRRLNDAFTKPKHFREFFVSPNIDVENCLN